MDNKITLEKELRESMIPFRKAFETLCCRHDIVPSEENYILFLETTLIYHQNSKSPPFRYLGILSLETVFFILLDNKSKQASNDDYHCAEQLSFFDLIETEDNNNNSKL